jgi:glucan-binding YG repeat protein
MKGFGSILARGTLTAVSALLISLIPALPAFAGSISTVSIRVDSGEDDAFQVGAYMDDSSVDVTIPTSDSEKYHVAEYSFNNSSGAYFSTNQDPTLTITLEAAEDYTFSLTKASEVKLTGDTKPVYKSALKKEDSTRLEVAVTLSALEGKTGSIEFADWNVNRDGTLEVMAYGGNNYQIQLYRDGKKYSSVIDVTGTGGGNQVVNMQPYIMSAGSYTFSVRQYNADTHSRGAWYTVENTYKVDEASAAASRSQYGYISRDGYGWQKDSTGWRYLTPGGYPANDWIRDNQHWFWFDEQGYMVTGWRLIGGKWYYFNGGGEMLENTTTPDGYSVGADGALLS